MKLPFRRKKSLPQRFMGMIGKTFLFLFKGIKNGVGLLGRAERNSGKRLRKAEGT